MQHEDLANTVLQQNNDQRIAGSQRWTICMPTGSGKTFVFLKEIDLHRDSRTIVILTSRISLMDQYLVDAVKYGFHFDKNLYAICSSSFNQTELEYRGRQKQKWVIVSNDKINTIKSDEPKIIVCLYTNFKSLTNIEGFEIDFMVCDEAHNAAVEKLFTAPCDFDIHSRDVLDRIRSIEPTVVAPSSMCLFSNAKEIQFYTATPRNWGKKVNVKSASNTNEILFGPLLKPINISGAINNGIIVPYRIVLMLYNEPEDKSMKNQAVFETFSNIIMRHKKRVDTYDQPIDKSQFNIRSLSYHNNIRNAKDFISHSSESFEFIDCVNGSESKKTYTSLSEFKKSSGHAKHVSSVKLLTEGISINSTNVILVCDPKHSETNIIQTFGRGLRKDAATKKTCCDIVIPIGVAEGETIEEACKRGKMNTLVKVITDAIEDGIDINYGDLDDNLKIDLFEKFFPINITAHDFNLDTLTGITGQNENIDDEFADCETASFSSDQDPEEGSVDEFIPEETDGIVEYDEPVEDLQVPEYIRNKWFVDEKFNIKSRGIARACTIAVLKKAKIIGDPVKMLYEYIIQINPEHHKGLVTKMPSEHSTNTMEKKYGKLLADIKNNGRYMNNIWREKIITLASIYDKFKKNKVSVLIDWILMINPDHHQGIITKMPLRSSSDSEEKKMANLLSRIVYNNAHGDDPLRSEVLRFYEIYRSAKGNVSKVSKSKKIESKVKNSNTGNSSRSDARESLSKMKVDDLKKICKDKNITGYSKLKKDDIIKKILEHD